MPIKMNFGPRIASNANLFAKRGNPWVTRREGIRDFGREPSVLSGTENPDMDCFTRAKKAPPHFERGTDKAIAPRELVASDRHKIANRVARMRNEMRAAEHVIVPERTKRDANVAANGVPHQARPGERRRKPILSLASTAQGSADE